MKLLRQLRWQLIASQMLVVFVGALVLGVTADVLGQQIFLTDLRSLTTQPGVLNPGDLEMVLVQSFRQAIAKSLTLAAVTAAVVGLATSLLLLRQILRPLHEIATSSSRIADGRYDERVTVPASDELAIVATSFNQMAGTLERIEQQRIALIGNVAHELRTPLTGLEGYLEGLIDGVFQPGPETFAEMQHEVRRLRNLVADLQILSNVEAGQVHLHMSELELVAVVRRMVEQLRPQTLAGCLEIKLSPGVEPVYVHADQDRVAQILINLIGNAIRYTPEGGCVTVGVKVFGRVAQVEVVDTGIGLAAEDLALIFERFYRVDRSRARVSGGSGIGLTISRHLAWAMGGDITAASPGVGQGSTFTLSMPLARSQRLSHEQR